MFQRQDDRRSGRRIALRPSDREQEREENEASVFSAGWDAGFQAAIFVLRQHFFKQTLKMRHEDDDKAKYIRRNR